MVEKLNFSFIISPELGGLRLDQALVQLLPEYSRTELQLWIKNGEVLLNNRIAKAKATVLGGETILIHALPKQQPAWDAQAINLNIVYEDEDLIVVNKPRGMVVHPASGNPNKTLLNALLHHSPQLQKLPRAGIIHRLDKDTSGLLVIAKTPAALKSLLAQMKSRSIVRIYQAIIFGLLTSGGTIEAPIGRHPIQRKRMTVIETGKPAISHYRLMEKYRAHTRIKVFLETGRTHQIRVHMAYVRHPIIGDPLYAGRLQIPKGATQELIDALRHLKHQALHAFELELTHPTTQQLMKWQAPLPNDMKQLIEILKNDKKLDSST